MRTGGLVRAAAGALLASVVGTGCVSRGPSEATEAKIVSAVGLRLQRTDLDGAELQRAKAWSSGYTASLVAAHPELVGLVVSGTYPVFDDKTAQPIGALVRMVLPAAVPVVRLDLIRSRGEVPERVPSELTNLRALDVIYEFRGSEVIFLGISPQSGDAADPSTETRARPLEPARHRDPAFGDDE